MLGLPAQYRLVDKIQGHEEEYLKMINSAFKFSFEESQFEITKNNLEKSQKLLYKCKENVVGFTVFRCKGNFSVQIFSLDIDGSIDGIFKSFKVASDQYFIVKNHPLLGLKFKSKEVIESIFFRALDETVLSSFDFCRDSCDLIDSKHLKTENVQKYSDEFCEKSFLVLKNFLRTVPMRFEDKNLITAGPSDYRNFKFINDETELNSFLQSKEFISYLSSLTGLPLLHPALPIYTRCIESPGDYQILHGNYSEPYGVDIIFNHYPSPKYLEWPESNCGRIHYLNDTGTEIFQVNPENNSLTIVYRTEGCSRFTENVKGFPEIPLYQTIGVFTVAAE